MSLQSIGQYMAADNLVSSRVAYQSILPRPSIHSLATTHVSKLINFYLKLLFSLEVISDLV
jgi:hypothetical protein